MNLVVELRFKIQTFSSRVGHCLVRSDFVRSGVSGKDFEFGGLLERWRTLSWLEVSILEVLRKTWLGYFYFIHTPHLIVQYSYTQEI
jgi:hypothetical protein